MKRVLLFLVLFSAGAAGAQDRGLTIKRPDGGDTILTAAALGSLARISGSATSHGTTFRYEGVDLRDVLRAAGVSPIDSLRGPLFQRVLRFVGADNYAVVIALSEIDRTVGARKIAIIDREDGQPLRPDRGPRRLFVEGDQRPARWVWQLVRIEVVDVR